MRMHTQQLLLAGAVLLLGAATVASAQQEVPPSVTLSNSNGFKVVLSPIGATIQSLLVPSCKTGKAVDVALGYDDAAGFLTDPHPSYGATVGRVASRVSNAKFSLDGKEYKLDANEGTASIHGGAVRWSKQTWAASPSADGRSVTFSYTSKDGESGYPGTVQAKVVYSIPADAMDLNITMTATTDKATPINMLNHNYFNLKGSGNGDILDHIVQIPSLYYTPSPQGSLLPTGQILAAKGTIYDFSSPTPIKKDYLKANGGPYKGFDLNYVMSSPDGGSLEPVWWKPGQNPQVGAAANSADVRLAATVTEPQTTGLKMTVLTNAPGIHFYSGAFMNAKDGSAGRIPNKGGIRYEQYSGFCFEAQGFPNAVNTPTFPSVIVRPDETYNNKVIYRFTC